MESRIRFGKDDSGYAGKLEVIIDCAFASLRENFSRKDAKAQCIVGIKKGLNVIWYRIQPFFFFVFNDY